MTLKVETPMMPSIEFHLLGGFDVRVDGRSLPPLRSRREQWLLALLVLRQDRDTARHWLATTLWPDNDEAQALFYLRKSLSNLRRALGGEAARLQTPARGVVRLELTGVSVDVAAFDAAIAVGSTEALERAVALYRGPLLPDCLEDWALRERTAREEAFYASLERLASSSLANGFPGTAASYLRRLIAASPLRESAYTVLMRALAASGDAAGVQETYRDLRLLLHRELHTEPASQTRALYEELQQVSQQPALRPLAQSALASSYGSDTPQLSSARRRLPVPLTRLIGRESEISDVVERFTRGRLVTLAGSGGVGKTRLSIAVAETVAGEFADGVWFVELAALTDSGLVAGTVAQALQLNEQPGQALIETLTSALSSRSLLLVLDNCEHLLDACVALVEELLRQCAGVRVLATSREALGLFGEWIYRVPSLAVPPLSESGTGSAVDKNFPSRLSEYAATALFLERAAAQSRSLRLTTADAVAIAEICVRLDGIPLAIEMAAARTRTMSVEDIRTRLSDRFGLLRSGSRASLPRQQTLRALIDWSYDLLDHAEKVLLRRLSVFAGGWRLEAAEQVCGGGENVVSLLNALVEKSLVVFKVAGVGTHYELLETVREYARDRLHESGEDESVRERHHAHYLALAEDAEPKQMGPHQAEWFERLEQEYENLRAALEWSLNRDDAADHHTSPLRFSGLRFCGALQRFWWTRGHFSEGRGWCAQALDKAHALERTWERARVLNGAGVLAYVQGDHAVARAYHEESLIIRREIGDRQGTASSLNNLGNVAFAQGDYALARAFLEESLAITREAGDLAGIGSPLTNLGNVAFAQGDYASARAFLEEGLTVQREIGNRDGIANSLSNLSNLAFAQGDYALARAHLGECLTILKETGNRTGTGIFLGNLGNVAFAQGDYASATTYYKEGLTILSEVGNRSAVTNSLEAFAALAARQSRSPLAAMLWAAAEALREEISTPLPPNEREKYDRDRAELREALGEEVFATAWATGRTMTMDQAIAYALEGHFPEA